MKASEIRNLSVQELNEKLSDLKSRAFQPAFPARDQPAREPHAHLALSRRTSPVLRPFIREKELAERK